MNAARAMPRRRGCLLRSPRVAGQSLLELGLALPLLLLILLGTVDLGRVFFDIVQLRNAAREGAGYAARNPGEDAAIRTRVIAHGVPDGVGTGDVAIVYRPSLAACTTVGTTCTVDVTVTHTFDPMATAFLGFLEDYGVDEIDLAETASMRAMT